MARTRFVYTVIMHNGIGFGLPRISTPAHTLSHSSEVVTLLI